MPSALHDQLVDAGYRWLKRKRMLVYKEMSTWISETPDVVGFQSSACWVVECKASRADFLADRKKRHHQPYGVSMGHYRYYLTPPGLLSGSDDLNGHGLLEADEKGRVSVVVEAPKWREDEEVRKWGHRMKNERDFLWSMLRRAEERVRVLERERQAALGGIGGEGE